MNIENLTILADYLETAPQSKFGMDAFARDEHGESLTTPQVHECASVACAMGSGPAAGIRILPSEVTWADYGERAFGLKFCSASWSWCFGGAWGFVDNTPAGAAKRIRYLMENGCPPLNSLDQQIGNAPYLFGTVH